MWWCLTPIENLGGQYPRVQHIVKGCKIQLDLKWWVCFSISRVPWALITQKMIFISRIKNLWREYELQKQVWSRQTSAVPFLPPVVSPFPLSPRPTPPTPHSPCLPKLKKLVFAHSKVKHSRRTDWLTDKSMDGQILSYRDMRTHLKTDFCWFFVAYTWFYTSLSVRQMVLWQVGR